MSEKSSWWLVAGFVAVKMILVGWWPYLADSQGDSSVFVQQSIYLLNGEWLGPYSDSTLATGPVTPIWIALMHFLGVPLLLFLHALNVGACVLCMMVFKRLSSSRGFQASVFGFLLFNPLTLDYTFATSAVHLSLEYSLALALLGVSLAVVAADSIAVTTTPRAASDYSGTLPPVFATQAIDTIDDHYSHADPVYRLEVSRLVNSPIRADEGIAPYLPDFYVRTMKNKTRHLGKLSALLLATIPSMFWLCVTGMVSAVWHLARGGRRFTAVHFQIMCLAGAAIVLLITLSGSPEAGRAGVLYFSFQALFYLLAATAVLCLARGVRILYRAVRR